MKSYFLKFLRTDFLFKIGFEQIVSKYGVRLNTQYT